MAGCSCGTEQPRFEGVSAAYRRVLWIVIGLNAGMFAVETAAGALAGSMALQADALDFLGDSATYALTLWAIGRSARWRATTALIKGGSLAVFAAVILGASLVRFFDPSVPEAPVMGAVGMLALATNVAAALLLFRWRDGDANVRSVWLCSRNDAIGNIAVVAAASGVWATGSGMPDLIVAAGLAGLFLWSSASILRQARGELTTLGRNERLAADAAE